MSTLPPSRLRGVERPHGRARPLRASAHAVGSHGTPERSDFRTPATLKQCYFRTGNVSGATRSLEAQ